MNQFTLLCGAAAKTYLCIQELRGAPESAVAAAAAAGASKVLADTLNALLCPDV